MMTRTIRIFILIAILAFPCFGQEKDAIKIAYPDFYPFFTETEKGEVKGFFYEIIIEALENRMGIQTSWAVRPWKRCQEEVKSGKFDAMITVPTEERMVYCDTHPDPFYLKELKLFTYIEHKKLNAINSIKTIADVKKGGFTVITYSGNGWHEKNISSMSIISHETSLIHNVWKMLAARRGDLVIEWPLGAYAGIKKVGVGDKILETDVALESMKFHLLINKKTTYKTILPQFNTVIQTMREDGTMERIISAYY
jgi:polar amino acid transport system substrate-binding protein